MWRACRAVALRQLKASAQASAGCASTAGSSVHRLFAAAQHFSTIGGVDRLQMLGLPAAKLRAELGPSRIAVTKKALSEELAAVIERGDAQWEEVRNYFVAAQKVRAVPAMMTAFEYMEKRFPGKVDFMVYGEVFRQLLRAGDGAKMLQIYEDLKPRYDGEVPEMVYRFGIVGKLEIDELEEASAIWQEMLAAGHEIPNEITSRLMMAYARSGDSERVLEFFNTIDPQVGQWHESAIDRVIVSLGRAREPEKAFEFYMNSSMKLNGGTLISLLSVCINNECHQQANDILANRKKFDLELDARAYNRILMTLEFLEKRDEIAETLEEMRSKNVPFDTMTRMIVDRNREVLQGTPFESEPMEKEEGNKQEAKSKHPNISRTIRKLLSEQDGEAAATIVDGLVSPLTASDLPEGAVVPEGAIKIGPSLSRDAVRAYILTGQHDKIAALLKTFSVRKGKYGHALVEILTHYNKSGKDQNDDLAYLATKAMLFQGRQIFRVDDALALARKYRDVETTVEVFDQVLSEYTRERNVAAAASEDDSDEEEITSGDFKNKSSGEHRKARRASFFNVGHAINSALQILVENGKLDLALETLDKLSAHDLRATETNYVILFSSMRDEVKSAGQHRGRQGKKNSTSTVRYDANAFEKAWDHMRQNKVRLVKGIIGNACPGFLNGNKIQRLKLLEGYAEAKNAKHDNYVLPPPCYTVLLKLTAREEGVDEVLALFNEAMATKKDGKASKEWLNVVINKLSSEGRVEEAAEFLSLMPGHAGGHPYEALVAVLRGAINAEATAVVTKTLASLDQDTYRVSLQDAYDLVHAAREHNQPNVGLEILRLFESSNFKADENSGSAVSEKQAAAFLAHFHDVHADVKLRTLYRVSLQIAERSGQWKSALSIRERITALWGADAVDDGKKEKEN